MTERTNTYFNRASSWSDEREQSSARSRRLAWTIAILTGSIALLEAVALALAMPLKTVAPIAVLVDRTTGRIERVDLNVPPVLRANEALQQSLLAQYVVARESYDPVDIRAVFRKVALWSGGQARASYLAEMERSPPSGRLAGGKREIGLAATVRSISMLGASSALVRFDVARVGYDGRLNDVRPYVSTIAFTFRGQPLTIEDRLDNPLGFEVRAYRVTAEAPPSAAPPVSTVAS